MTSPATGDARSAVGTGRAAVARRTAVGSAIAWRAAVHGRRPPLQLRGERLAAVRAGAHHDVVADRLGVAGARIAERARVCLAPRRILRIIAPARRADPLGARLARPAQAFPDRGAARDAGGAI